VFSAVTNKLITKLIVSAIISDNFFLQGDCSGDYKSMLIAMVTAG